MRFPCLRTVCIPRYYTNLSRSTCQAWWFRSGEKPPSPLRSYRLPSSLSISPDRFLWGTNWIYICYIEESIPPLWSSGQSSWLHNGDVLCFLWGTNWIYICHVEESRPPLWSGGQSSWLQIPALPDFLRSSGSGTGSTQPHEYNWGEAWKK
jgi:hypothetical protein